MLISILFCGLTGAYSKVPIYNKSTTPPRRVPCRSHLLVVLVLALLFPLPILLSHWPSLCLDLFHDSIPEATGHTCSDEGQIYRPVALFTCQAPDCQSALMAANPWATRCSKTLWQYPPDKSQRGGDRTP